MSKTCNSLYTTSFFFFFMDLPWGDERSVQFITNVGLITSDGPHGPNIMSAEWTHHISYSPGLIAVCIRKKSATYDNISKTKEFGINIASTEQNVLASISGNYKGKEVRKINALTELGFAFYPGKKIKTFMVKDAVSNFECTLFQKIELGDHIMFVGEVVEAVLNNSKEPLAYHKCKYWKIGENIHKPSEKEKERITKIVEKNKKN